MMFTVFVIVTVFEDYVFYMSCTEFFMSSCNENILDNKMFDYNVK